MTLTLAVTEGTSPPRRGRSIRPYLLEAKYEILKQLRLPAYVIPTITFPVVFYVMFGLAFGGSQSVGQMSLSAYLLATYGAFGVIGASLFGFGIGVAIERGQGWLQIKRATPMPIGAYFSAKLVMSVLFSTAIVLILLAVAAVGGTFLGWAQSAALVSVLVAGSIPFCAMGLFLGYATGPNSAPAIANLIYLPLAFASGLWIPVEALPSVVRSIAPWLPPYHLAQLALGVIGGGVGAPPSSHLLALGGFTLIFLLLARIAYQRDEGKSFG